MIFIDEKTLKGSVRAYAKINLDLYVTGRRSDGFHELSTLMTPVSLYDTLTILVEKGKETKVILTSDCPSLPTDGTNLASRAALSFLREIGENARVTIHIRKRIPVAAGLGGGSSDAAAVLRFMNGAYAGALSKEKLYELALSIGSDVPFCLYRKMARCAGRGEVFRRVRSSIALYALIAIGEEALSTKEIFSELDRRFPDFLAAALYARTFAPALDDALSIGNTVGIAECARNMFADVVFDRCPVAKKVHAHMKKTAAFATGVSGSGPSVFGLFTDEGAAIAAQRWFSCDTFVAKLLN